MATAQGRYLGAGPAQAAPGWWVERLTPPSRLHGANGLATGSDGRLYVAQVPGSQISAIDVDSGAIVAPDDLVFDEAGNLYATETSPTCTATASRRATAAIHRMRGR